MKKISVIAFVVSLLSHAASWTDSNGVEWTMFKTRTNHSRAVNGCRAEGFRLPSAEDFWEAIDLGLLDPKVNQAFGSTAKHIDWIWINQPIHTPSFAWIASRWEDTAGEEIFTRHWALCARPAR